ncbi:MAG: isochorismate synthase [Ktedonobacteraceae bacterium]|nr:isochorismate synthase [Ktedonobacteraceae bacterium]
METIFTDTPAARLAAGGRSLHYGREQLLALLRRAASQANRQGQEILASLIIPVSPLDALLVWRAFRHLHEGECYFWELPARQTALVGTKPAVTIETGGAERFSAASAAWRSLLQNAIIAHGAGSDERDGPMFFGGFAFDPLNSRTPLWQHFPDGLLVLPTLLYHQNGEHAAFIISSLVSLTSNEEALAKQMATLLARLQQALNVSEDLPVTAQSGKLAVRDLISREDWQGIVADAVREIRHGAYQKVVLARSIQVTREEGAFDVEATLARLRESYASAYVFAFQRGERFFTGATPERLISARDGQLRTMALAGSFPRGTTEEEDQRLGAELLASEKNREEHEIVVKTLKEALASLCTKVHVADTAHLLRLKNIQHLETPIFGELLPDHSVLEALAVLHPTPAVGGLPREAALAAIRAKERLDRGWYAGPVGWLDARGDGEFAVALRSALIEGNQAILFTGCGIVADSVPESE